MKRSSEGQKLPKVYSPSSTTTFQRCPQLWVHQRTWQPKALGNPACAAAVGIGISYGMELIFQGVELSTTLEEAANRARAFIDDRIEAGGYLLPAQEKTYELIPKRVEKALRRFWKESPLPTDWQDFRTELTFPDHGNCRVDLLHNSALGPCITDFKTKVAAADYIVDSFMFDAETSWQMYHYIWAAREMGIHVESFSIVLIVIEPFHVYLDQWVVDEDHLKQWLLDARRWWQLMEFTENGYVHPLRVGDHRDKYGLCEMHSACLGRAQFGMEVDYTRRVRH